MSDKHFFNDPTGLVERALRSYVTRTPHLQLDEPHRVVSSKTHTPDKVAIISGGGSGHEPAWTGYVGDGMLSASVAGGIFASPSTKQVMAAINSVPSDAGTILCITNYTGDRLHFGLAREKVNASGRKIAQIAMSDDVSLPQSKVQNLGRRGLAGHVIILKLLGAASQLGWGFEECLQLGEETNANIASIGTSLDLCHVMGRAPDDRVAQDACVLGMGVHNEPGLRTISPVPPPSELINTMLGYVLDPYDPERNFVTFNPGDDVCLLVNNLGGLSTLEIEGLTQVILEELANGYGMKPSRIYVGPFETSLNGPGFSLSLCNLSAISKATRRPLDTIKDLLDAPTAAVAWPRSSYSTRAQPKAADVQREQESSGNGIVFIQDITNSPPAPSSLLPALKAACNAAIAAEPDITRFDMMMGDGDCGEAVKEACQALLTRFESAPFTQDPLPLYPALDAINETLEDIGGSLFAILSILSTAFVAGLNNTEDVTAAAVGKAAGSAIKSLLRYTGARVGDRTCMDVLIPLCEALESGAGLGTTVHVAEEAAASTANMKPKFGRATYVGEQQGGPGDMPSDPGAYAVAKWLAGFSEGWNA
ncbi:Dak1 domain-containing protein [Aspergillus pseudoustus]|uniref:Dak1 domain-containing protein n=1 Tax=Aspergillus pseudoustus TaxID=1810923 RepID=A0ABR4JVU2_9EURO